MTRLLLLLGVAALVGGCASVAEQRALERDVRTLQAQESGSGAGATTRVADLAARVDSLEAELRRLEGQIEVADHNAAQALEEAQKARREAQTPGGGPVSESGGGAAGVAAARPEPAPLGSASPGAAPKPALPQVASTPATAAPSAAPEASAATGSNQPGASSEEVQAYRTAFAAWQRNDTDACIDQFRRFLNSYPSSIYADDGAYWMADCYYKKGDYKLAVMRFDDVVARYPKGNKAADALYMHGESLVKLGPSYSKAARRAFERVTEEYPDSPRAAEAQRQIELLDGGGKTAAKPGGASAGAATGSGAGTKGASAKP
ncbi:MAG TPA: outer membrane protein assembly factor BamD [Myxococcota bacterium]|nr:outer membrane protein assembly factor BamD [Myxococcota bacterium]